MTLEMTVTFWEVRLLRAVMNRVIRPALSKERTDVDAADRWERGGAERLTRPSGSGCLGGARTQTQTAGCAGPRAPAEH